MKDDVIINTVASNPPTNTELTDVYRPLNRAELCTRMADNFPATYLTMISIIQGVAIGVFAQNSFGAMNSVSQTISHLPYYVISFLLIALVFWEYVWFTGIYRWSVKLSDTFAPLLLGVLEIGSFYFFDNPPFWWLMNGFICAAGTFAFSNTHRHVSRNMFEDGDLGDAIYQYTRRDIGISMLTTSIASLTCFLVAGLHLQRDFGRVLRVNGINTDGVNGALYVVYLVLILALFVKDHRFVRRIHSEYRLHY